MSRAISTAVTLIAIRPAGGVWQQQLVHPDQEPNQTGTCTGACAAAWPPLTTSGTAMAGGQASSAHLGTITRSGGVKQVTYGGHPLYYFVRDTGSSVALGQGVKAFGGSWYVLAPVARRSTIPK